MKNITIKIIDMSEMQKEFWDSVLQKDPCATVFHTQEWMNTLQDAYGYKPKYLIATDEHESFVAAMPFMIDTRFGIENYLSMPFDTYGGCIGDFKYFDIILKKFCDLPGNGVRYYVDFNLFSDGELFSTEIMDISKSESDILKKLHKANRTAIKSASKRDVIVHDIETNINVFDKVSDEMISSIIKNMIPHGLCKIYLATVSGGIAASSIFFIYKDVVMYWANTTTELGRKTNANYLVLWTAIKYGKEKGCTTFNFGASPKNADSLVKFKKSWGTRSHVYTKCQKVPKLLSPILKIREVFHG